VAGAPKAVADPVHGTIQLSSLEADIISTPAFQRLRNVKQLGLAHMVFPGADYSRFSHCLGVCHVTKRILKALRDRGVQIEPEEETKYRLAGLLHDVGHYPFSHVTERALSAYLKKSLIIDEKKGEENGGQGAGAEDPYLDHEQVGKEVIALDPDIREILDGAKIDPTDISAIFAREKPPRFANLVSSDLDADRIDFLMRTAHNTGLPYGRIDLDYLVGQLCLDKESKICIQPKALRTVEHFLLGRYFDYQQVAFHKTVAGLELVLEEVLRAVLDAGLLTASASDIRKRIAANGWYAVDDTYALSLIRTLADMTKSDVIRRRAEAILLRQPPKLLAIAERLANRDQEAKNRLLSQEQMVREKIPAWAHEFGIPNDFWYVWSKAGQSLTKIGSRVPVSEKADQEVVEQVVKVLNVHDNTSRPIVEVDRSLMSILSNYALYTLRVYVLLPAGMETKREKIEERIRKDLPHTDWL
jgi:HD superfamily phosphohydrolase